MDEADMITSMIQTITANSQDLEGRVDAMLVELEEAKARVEELEKENKILKQKVKVAQTLKQQLDQLLEMEA